MTPASMPPPIVPPPPNGSTRMSVQDQPLSRLHIWQIQAVRDVLLVLVILGVLWLGYAIRAVTVPLLIALLLAYLFEPLVSSLTKRFKASRPVVVGGILASIGVGVLIVLAILVPLVVGQTVRLVNDVRSGRFENAAIKFKQYVPAEYQADYEKALIWVMPGVNATSTEPNASQPAAHDSALTAPLTATDDDQRIRNIVRDELNRANISANSGTSLGWVDVARASGETVFNILGAIVTLGLLAFLIPFYFFFFSVSFPTVAKFGKDLIPLANRGHALDLIQKMDRAVAGFVRGRIVICAIVGVLLAAGWWIIGVPYAVIAGIVVGAFFVVPFLSAIGVPLAILLLATEQLGLPAEQRMSWLAIILWPTIWFVVINAVETYVLTPLIAGKATNLDPVTILVAVLAGGALAGVYGMILAIPVAACMKILCTDVLLPKIRAWTKGRAADPLPLG